MGTKLLEPDNAERGAMLRHEANAAELEAISKIWKEFDDDCRGIESRAISSVNKARELGIHLQAMCGHQQMTLGFWNAQCQKKLPFDFDAARLFVGIANKMEQPAKTLAEAVPLVQMVLQADGILLLSERTEKQAASTISVIQKFFAEVTLIRADFKKALQEKPMEEWGENALVSFLSETEWIAEERERAESLKSRL